MLVNQNHEDVNTNVKGMTSPDDFVSCFHDAVVGSNRL